MTVSATPNVEVLQSILNTVRKHKLMVTLAFRLKCAVPTIYNWCKIADEARALERLLQISRIEKNIAEDGAIMIDIIDQAINAVRSSVGVS